MPHATVNTVSPVLQSVVSPDAQQRAGSCAAAKQARSAIPANVKNTRTTEQALKADFMENVVNQNGPEHHIIDLKKQ
jgi:hypothetical protein